MDTPRSLYWNNLLARVLTAPALALSRTSERELDKDPNKGLNEMALKCMISSSAAANNPEVDCRTEYALRCKTGENKYVDVMLNHPKLPCEVLLLEIKYVKLDHLACKLPSTDAGDDSKQGDRRQHVQRLKSFLSQLSVEELLRLPVYTKPKAGDQPLPGVRSYRTSVFQVYDKACFQLNDYCKTAKEVAAREATSPLKVYRALVICVGTRLLYSEVEEYI